jgi:hypothetical protein
MLETIDYKGWPGTIRLSNGDAEVIAVTAVGPRILRYGFIEGPNAFDEDPATLGKTGGAKWQPYGGHRVWHSPEKQGRTDEPDNGPAEVEVLDSGELRVGNPPDMAGIAKEMIVALAPKGCAVRVRHRLTNHGMWDVTLAPWSLSIVAHGGRVVLPQEDWVSHGDDVDPVRPVVLWKFTEMSDPRWRWGARYISLRSNADTKAPQKAGVYNAKGWGAHLTDEQAFIALIDPGKGGPTANSDFGCNFETYTEGAFQELETLGPLVTLKPGESAEHVEHWFIAKTGPIPDDDDSLDAKLLPIVAQAREAVAAAF